MFLASAVFVLKNDVAEKVTQWFVCARLRLFGDFEPTACSLQTSRNCFFAGLMCNFKLTVNGMNGKERFYELKRILV